MTSPAVGKCLAIWTARCRTRSGSVASRASSTRKPPAQTRALARSSGIVIVGSPWLRFGTVHQVNLAMCDTAASVDRAATWLPVPRLSCTAVHGRPDATEVQVSFPSAPFRARQRFFWAAMSADVTVGPIGSSGNLSSISRMRLRGRSLTDTAWPSIATVWRAFVWSHALTSCSRRALTVSSSGRRGTKATTSSQSKATAARRKASMVTLPSASPCSSWMTRFALRPIRRASSRRGMPRASRMARTQPPDGVAKARHLEDPSVNLSSSFSRRVAAWRGS